MMIHQVFLGEGDQDLRETKKCGIIRRQWGFPQKIKYDLSPEAEVIGYKWSQKIRSKNTSV